MYIALHHTEEWAHICLSFCVCVLNVRTFFVCGGRLCFLSLEGLVLSFSLFVIGINLFEKVVLFQSVVLYACLMYACCCADKTLHLLSAS